MKSAATINAAMIHARLRCNVKGGVGVFGANRMPKHCVIQAIPEVPPNDAAAAESGIRIQLTGFKTPAAVLRTLPLCRE